MLFAGGAGGGVGPDRSRANGRPAIGRFACAAHALRDAGRDGATGFERRTNGLTYAAAGVDIDAGNALVERIKPAAGAHRARRRRWRASAASARCSISRPRVSATRCWSPRPTASAPSCASRSTRGQLDDDRHRPRRDVRQRPGLPGRGAAVLPRLLRHRQARRRRRPPRVIDGHRRGLRPAPGCALVGGETAEMPGMYHGGDFDLAGLRGRRDGARRRTCRAGVAAGDVLLGLASTGVHSNGYSLVRRVVEVAGLGWDARALRRRRDARRGAADADADLRAARCSPRSARAACMRSPTSPAAASPRTCRASCPRASAPRSTSAPGRCRRCSAGCAQPAASPRPRC